MGKKKRRLFSPKFAAWRAQRDKLRAGKNPPTDPVEEKVEEKVEETVKPRVNALKQVVKEESDPAEKTPQPQRSSAKKTTSTTRKKQTTKTKTST